jgi:hypothetical protein
MATVAQTIQKVPSSWNWIRDFLVEELSPYPGRFAVLARMTISATLIMISCEALRVPEAFQAAILTLLVTRKPRRPSMGSRTALRANLPGWKGPCGRLLNVKRSIDTAMPKQSAERREVLEALVLLASRSEKMTVWLDANA